MNVEPKTYRKIPVEIQSLQWTGDNLPAMAKFMGGDLRFPERGDNYYVADGSLYIRNSEGTLRAAPRSYIIQGVQGEFYPCPEEVFLATYEEASE